MNEDKVIDERYKRLMIRVGRFEHKQEVYRRKRLRERNNTLSAQDERYKRLMVRARRFEHKQETYRRMKARKEFQQRRAYRQPIRFPFGLLDDTIHLVLEIIEYVVWMIVALILG